MENQPTPAIMPALVSLLKRTGYVFPSSEIYGGLNGFFDYGPMGTVLKNNIRDSWWNAMVEKPPIGPDDNRVNILGLDTSIILNPKVWEASGHVGGFNDKLSDCTETKKRYRADHILCYEVRLQDDPSSGPWYIAMLSADDMEKAIAKRAKALEKLIGKGRLTNPDLNKPIIFSELPASERERILAPEATTLGTLSEPRAFGLMFETSVGALADSDSKAYLRPETAQGIFINFKNVVDSMRVRVPFGIAQVGKAFRNEITPRNFIFRSREFEQMEMEWFCEPEKADEWFEFWKEERKRWWLSLGIREENLTFRMHDADELAHYSSCCIDVEYRFPFANGGFAELEGIAQRSDYDLKQHAQHSRAKLEFLDQVLNKQYLPYVIEPSAGLTRALLAVLCDAYRKDETRPSAEYLALPPNLAPITVAVFSLTPKEGMPEFADALGTHLSNFFTTKIDHKQSIGKRYAKMDEVGTPFCVTIDSDTMKDGTVTIRHRDTLTQDRISADKVDIFLNDRLNPNAKKLGSFEIPKIEVKTEPTAEPV